MKEKEAIDFLEQLETGRFLTVNIPLSSNENIPCTAMYMGKDNEGRYNFIDTSRFCLTKEFLQRGKVSIDKEFNEDKVMDIYAKVKMEEARQIVKKHDRESR